MISTMMPGVVFVRVGIGWVLNRECKCAKFSRYSPIAARTREPTSEGERALSICPHIFSRRWICC